MLLPGGVSWPRLTLQCNGRSETELGAEAVSGRTSGLNGQISVDLSPATANLWVEVFIQASVNSFEN
jgi:hypothetical protein